MLSTGQEGTQTPITSCRTLLPLSLPLAAHTLGLDSSHAGSCRKTQSRPQLVTHS